MLWKGMFDNSISKRQHVNSYTNHAILKPATRMVAKGLFGTVFRCSSGQIFVLRLNCRADPILVTLYGCVVAEHPLIDGDMHVRIAYHNDKLLGAAVMDSIVQMQLNPPRIIAFTDDNVRALQPRPGVQPVSDPAGSFLTPPRTYHDCHRVCLKDQAQTVVGQAGVPSIVWADAYVAARDPSGTYNFDDAPVDLR